MASAEPADRLNARVDRADGPALLELVDELGDGLEAPLALRILRSPFADGPVVQAVAAVTGALRSYDVRLTLARHRHTPRSLAQRMVPGLYWSDLLDVAVDVRTPPAIRRSAERYLAARWATLGTGEKRVIARKAPPALLASAIGPSIGRSDHLVGLALLDNPRLTEGTLVALLRRDAVPPELLAVAAAHRKWGSRYEVRRALAGNRTTPSAVALRLLPHLRRPDQRAVATDPRLAAEVRRRARLLAEGR